MRKKAVLIVTALYLFFMAFNTAHAVRRYQAELPTVELGVVQVEKEIFYTVPASAVFEDGLSEFLWLVEESDGPWGKEYRVQKKYISVFQVDGETAWISSTVDLPIVIGTDVDLYEGQPVQF